MKAWWWGLMAVILAAGMGMAQEAAKESPALTDAQTLKAVPILRKMAELRQAFNGLQVELEKVRMQVVKEHSLDPAKYTVNWDTGKLAPIHGE